MRHVALGEIAEIVSGATPKTSVAEFWGGDIDWATPADLSRLDAPYISATSRRITAAGLRSCGTTVLPSGSVLLSSRAPIGHVAINTVPMATNQGFKSLVPGSDLESKYLYYWLKSKTKYLQSLGNGATFKELSKKTTTQIKVPLPPLAEQRRIARILDRADMIRTKRRQLLAHVNSLTQSVFHEMFGAEPWSSSLGELVEVQVGPFGSLLHQEDYAVGGVPLINPMHIRDGALRPDPEFATTEAKAAGLAQYRLRRGDVVLGRRGEMGRAGIVLEEHEGALCGTGSLILRPREIHTVFLHAVVTSARMKEHFERSSLGATMPNLNGALVKAAPFPRPSASSQNEFANRVAHNKRLQRKVGATLDADDELFASLQSRAFRGEL